MLACKFASICEFKCAVLLVSEILEFLRMASIHFTPVNLLISAPLPPAEIPRHQIMKPHKLNHKIWTSVLG